ncbi:TPA: hypothetical protein EYP38_04960 [Candidatus Micrarchaeota archaeon]|nr:hypothetical protein [Candidatus Micrarchaeota archaeon]
MAKTIHRELWPASRNRTGHLLALPAPLKEQLIVRVQEGKVSCDISSNGGRDIFRASVADKERGSAHVIDMPGDMEFSIFIGRMARFNDKWNTRLVSGKEAMGALVDVVEGYRKRHTAMELETGIELTPELMANIMEPSRTNARLWPLFNTAIRVELVKVCAFGSDGELSPPDQVLAVSEHSDTVSAASGLLRVSQGKSILIPFASEQPNCFVVGENNDELMLGEQVHVTFSSG